MAGTPTSAPTPTPAPTASRSKSSSVSFDSSGHVVGRGLSSSLSSSSSSSRSSKRRINNDSNIDDGNNNDGNNSNHSNNNYNYSNHSNNNSFASSAGSVAQLLISTTSVSVSSPSKYAVPTVIRSSSLRLSRTGSFSINNDSSAAVLTRWGGSTAASPTLPPLPATISEFSTPPPAPSLPPTITSTIISTTSHPQLHPKHLHHSPPSKPSDSNRWFVLFLCCFLLFGNYYAYDNPAALNRQLQLHLDHDYDLYQYELNLLYSVYSFPNMFMPFIGGQFVDRFDSRKVLMMFSVIVCAGQTLFSIGVSMRHFGVMLFGRALFGIGGEAISVIQASITSEWFKNKELAFALGLNICIARFGSVTNSILSPRIESATDVPTAIWIGSLMCYLSFLSAVILCLMMNAEGGPASVISTSSELQLKNSSASPPTLPEAYQQASLTDSLRKRLFGTSATSSAETSPSTSPESSSLPTHHDHHHRELSFFLDGGNASSSSRTTSPVQQDLDYDLDVDVVIEKRQSKTIAGSSNNHTTTTNKSLIAGKDGLHSDASMEDFSYHAIFSEALASIRKFPPSFWLICLICVLLYGTVVPFNNIASDFLMSKWYPNDPASAGLAMSVPDSMSAILVPIWGAVVDRFGGRVLQLVLSSLAIAIVHLLLSLTMINPIFPLILLGLSYSVYGVAIWPSIALVVQHQQRLEQEDRHQQRQQQPRWRRIHEDEEEVNTAAAERRPLLLRSSSSSSSSSSSASETETGESHATSRIIGTAYGISTSALNTSLTLFPLITAQIRVSGGSFTHVLLFFVGLALLGAMASVYLWRLDSRSGFVLQLPQKFEEEEEDKVEHEDREREEET